MKRISNVAGINKTTNLFHRNSVCLMEDRIS